MSHGPLFQVTDLVFVNLSEASNCPVRATEEVARACNELV